MIFNILETRIFQDSRFWLHSVDFVFINKIITIVFYSTTPNPVVQRICLFQLTNWCAPY